jgi:hypothetical protein
VEEVKTNHFATALMPEQNSHRYHSKLKIDGIIGTFYAQVKSNSEVIFKP